MKSPSLEIQALVISCKIINSFSSLLATGTENSTSLGLVEFCSPQSRNLRRWIRWFCRNLAILFHSKTLSPLPYVFPILFLSLFFFSGVVTESSICCSILCYL